MIKIGENEYEPDFRIFLDREVMQNWIGDANCKPITRQDILSALNELASLRQAHPDTVGDEATNFDAYLSLNPTAFRIFNDMRQERDALKKRVEELEKALDIANNQERCGQ